PYVDHMQKGINEFEGGDYFEAREQFFKALATARKNKLSKNKVADALHHLISASAESKEYDMANDYLTELAELSGVKSYTKIPETAEAAETYFDKALLLMLGSDSDLRKAADIIQKARGYYEGHDGHAGDTMRCLATLGQIKILENNFSEAKKYMDQAVEIAKSDPTVSQLELALRMDQLGDAYILLSQKTKGKNYFDEAAAEYSEALDLRQDTLNSKDHAALAQSYLRLGVVNYLKDDYNKALENLNKSLEIRTKQGRPLAIAEVKRAISYVYLAQKKPQDASKAFEDAIATAQKAGPEAEKHIAKWKTVFSKISGIHN
ncbi:MAG: tetratricopeptide repeat protein, partial [Candidatus Obscuribacterales bacterium]|nr:tetratricopeptide repeat protein [Candidatus Obscuribacterales bacterium]